MFKGLLKSWRPGVGSAGALRIFSPRESRFLELRIGTISPINRRILQSLGQHASMTDPANIDFLQFIPEWRYPHQFFEHAESAAPAALASGKLRNSPSAAARSISAE